MAVFRDPGSRKPPDGGVAHVFESDFRAGVRGSALLVPGMDRVTECRVTFADKIELTGLSVERRGGNLEVTYRWQCLRRVDRDYCCFTHLVDSRDHIVANLDHALLSAQPAVSLWKAGDIAIEKLRFRLPEEADRELCHLRLGLFDRESGERLQITSSSLQRLPLSPAPDAVCCAFANFHRTEQYEGAVTHPAADALSRRRSSIMVTLVKVTRHEPRESKVKTPVKMSLAMMATLRWAALLDASSESVPCSEPPPHQNSSLARAGAFPA